MTLLLCDLRGDMLALWDSLMVNDQGTGPNLSESPKLTFPPSQCCHPPQKSPAQTVDEGGGAGGWLTTWYEIIPA